MWAYERVFYQFYPMGFCGAPYENDGKLEHRILKVLDFIPHLKQMNIGGVYFSPIFESDTHGYNTRDYRQLDKRLGTNEDFKIVCETLHKEGIKVLLDGVFNHVGRGFYPFRDVLEKRENSPYKDWFFIDFGGDSPFHDGLRYEGWEGHFDLVKLNLRNQEVVEYLLQSVKLWIEEFDIDGLRLDVAYMVDREFLKRLRFETDKWKKDFFLAGEMIHGDYNQIVNDGMCHSATNYECYKGLHSSFNSMNLFEIMHSLNRQFGEENWTLYRGKHLISFVDNHDVSRIASVLSRKEHLPLIYTMLMGMPGIPMLYYGSEWGTEGEKKNGDPSLRPSFDHPQFNELSEHIAKLAKIYSERKALQYGSFRTLQIQNKACAFLREYEDEKIVVLINAGEEENRLHFPLPLKDGETIEFLLREGTVYDGGITLPPYSSFYLKI